MELDDLLKLDRSVMLTLDTSGLLLAFLLGASIFVFGAGHRLFFLGVMVWFLLISAIVTWAFKKRKKKLGVYENARSWKNVVSNGGVPMLAVFLYYISLYINFASPNIFIVAYLASIAAVAADKFSSEIGVLGGKPIMLLTLKKSKVGVSGGVTVLGTASGIAAAILIASAIFLVHVANPVFYFIVIVASGIAGNITDSILGYYENNGIGNKYTSNAACSAVGFALGIIFLSM